MCTGVSPQACRTPVLGLVYKQSTDLAVFRVGAMRSGDRTRCGHHPTRGELLMYERAATAHLFLEGYYKADGVTELPYHRAVTVHGLVNGTERATVRALPVAMIGGRSNQ
jgi:hypothetical protein